MQDLAHWLEQLGMSEYAERFAENKIDVAVLRHLTDQDLKDIGVALGHRRKMLAAISEVAAATATEPKFFEPEPKPQEIAERRQVTVMFSHLVGSTALSARMDPEDLRQVISAYQKCVAPGGATPEIHGRRRARTSAIRWRTKTMPNARYGLGWSTAVADLKTRAALQTRIGIATGLVVVGDLIGSGSAQEQAVVGETPNLAARLQGLAKPGSLLIAQTTRQLNARRVATDRGGRWTRVQVRQIINRSAASKQS